MNQENKNEQAVLVQPESKKDASSVSENVASPTTPKKKSTVKPVADFKPDYATDQAKVQRLKELTAEVEREIDAVVEAHDIYGSVKVDENVVINVRTAVKNGIHLFGMSVNREHGKDEQKTGASILADGAQSWVEVVTYKIAKLYGIKVRHLTNDADQTSDPEDTSLVLIDGHGRLDYLMQYDVNEWPLLYAHFPAKDALGYYNINKIMELINVNSRSWNTAEFVQKRILEDGDGAHKGWWRIVELVKRGYNYQAACQLCTLGKDRIKKTEVIKGDASVIFENYDDALLISEALIQKFGEGEDKTLKTKMFSMVVAELWQQLPKNNSNQDATELFLKFIRSLSDEKVAKIKNAKRSKNGVTKDEARKLLLYAEFNQFVGREGIKLVS